MTVKANLFPGGVRRALTMSYDDGQIFDVRLAELLINTIFGAPFILTAVTWEGTNM